MNLGRVKAMARKEFLQIVRDPRSLGMAIAIPMLMLVLFGYALSLDVDRVPLVVKNLDRSNLSRDFVLRFDQSPYFHIVERVDDDDAIVAAIDTGRALMALSIPENFSKELAEGASSPAQLIVDGSDSNTATIAIGYATAIAQAYNRTLLTARMARAGLSAAPPIGLVPRVWFNEDLKSRNFIIPGLIAVIMMVIAALITSLTVAREWERGTMEQLIATPVSAFELILGKFLPYFAIGMLDVLIAVAMGEFLFHIPLRGSMGLLFLLSALFLTGVLSLGLLISITTRSQLLASQLAIITTFLPSFLLSGYMFAISNMPYAIQLITYLIPARYFIVILRGIYLKGVGIAALLFPIVFLMLFAVATVAIASRKFVKRVA